MAYTITSGCISCGTCAEECPAQAIQEGDAAYSINQEACTGCGTCMEVCPTEAIAEQK